MTLDSANCFGVRLKGGARVAGESNGYGYGVKGTTGVTDDRPWVQIGFLYVEFQFNLGGKSFPAGSYLLLKE